MTTTQKLIALLDAGLLVGKRDLRINTNYPGKYMVVEPFDDSELPTCDGSNGPWAIVGDDLFALIDDAYAHYPLIGGER